MHRIYRRGRWYYDREPPRRSLLRKLFSWLLAIAFFALGALVTAKLETSSPTQEPVTGPAYVIDGDTLVVNRRHIRLQGIDAPEMEQTCHRRQQAYDCGADARNALKSLIGGRNVRCAGGSADKYRRLLADCRMGETDLNREMVEKGWAVAYGRYAGEEEMARTMRRGMWAGTFQRPQDWRKAHQAPDTTSTLEIFMEKLYLWIKSLIPKNA
ncbi:thermonuclease family protein [Phyllobacterium leguminum]|uniref:Endonuclease YncB(Thermonuclease family) n=1 Tax=Phyllobacterium leguminum TaxID=314237 RepID=A0A318T111_9HYPH|nr:thermonuclease family protein [Phyllobacterium leguminum]PYE86446.1 endonuclease YncB(thermonuclease family) [Phyllobacterium leguminum]